MVLPLLGEELQRALVPIAGLQRPAQRKVVELGIEDADLAPQLLRRMGVGVRHQAGSGPGTTPASSSAGPRRGRSRPRRCAARDPRSSRRWRRSRTSSRGRRTRGSRYGQGTRYEPGSGLQCDLQQVPRVEPQDRPSVRVRGCQSGTGSSVYPLRRVEVRGVDQVVDLPGLVVLLVDRGDFDRQHEPGGGALTPAGGRQPLLDRPFDIVTKAKQPRLRGYELFLDLGPPGGWVKSPVPTMAMPFLRAQMARCSRSQFRLVAREYLEWTCRSA